MVFGEHSQIINPVEVKIHELKKAFLAGFMITREGGNAECPMEEHMSKDPDRYAHDEEECWKTIKPFFDEWLSKNNISIYPEEESS